MTQHDEDGDGSADDALPAIRQSSGLTSASERRLAEFGPAAQRDLGATGQSMVAASIREVEARVTVAQRFPRNERVCVERILVACGRPRLAEDSSYAYAKGGATIAGASIRLAEEIARCWGNFQSEVRELERNSDSSLVEAYAWDLERNVREAKTFIVRHQMDTKNGPKRLTSDRDIYEHIANMGARRKRACILALIPSDVVESALSACAETLKTDVGDLTEKLPKMTEAFGNLGVTQAMLETRIQRSILAIAPGQYVQLRRIYASIQDGVGMIGDFFEVTGTGSQGGSPLAQALAGKAAQAKPASNGKPAATEALPCRVCKSSDDRDGAWVGAGDRRAHTACVADETRTQEAKAAIGKGRGWSSQKTAAEAKAVKEPERDPDTGELVPPLPDDPRD